MLRRQRVTAHFLHLCIGAGSRNSGFRVSLDKLQIEAYTEAGIPRTSSNTKMEKVRRNTLPPQHESVMDLKPGEVSEEISDPGGAHFIYKMIGKRTLTLEEAKTGSAHGDFQPALS